MATPDKAQEEITGSIAAGNLLSNVSQQDYERWQKGDASLHDDYGRNIFHYLATSGELDIAKKVAVRVGDDQIRAMLRESDSVEHATPLHRLCGECADTQMLEWFRAHGADINVLDMHLQSPLDRALRKLPGETGPLRSKRAAMAEGLRRHGARSGEELVAAQLRARAEKYDSPYQLLEGENADIVTPKPPKPEDFKSIPELPEMQELGPPVTLVVIEKLNDKKGIHSEHIQATSYIANGVFRKLMGDDEASGTVIGLQEYLNDGVALTDAQLKSPVAALMQRPEVKEGAVVFSHSIYTGDEPNWNYYANYAWIMPKNPREKALWEACNPTVYFLAGNEQDRGLHVRQDWGAHYALPRAIRVGAVKPLVNSPQHFKLREYTEEGAALTAPLPPNYEGTSFSTPVAAGLHVALMRRYGQWKNNPYGITPEEAQQAILLSADKKVIDDTTGKEAKYALTNAGMPYHDRAGSGTIDPLKADALAKAMYKFKQGRKMDSAQATVSITIRERGHAMVDTPDQDGWYHYKIPIAETMWVHNVTPDVWFKETGNDFQQMILRNESRTREARLIYNGTAYVTNLSRDGTATITGMAGTLLHKGTVLTLQTQQPLEKGGIRIHGMTPRGNGMASYMANETMKQAAPQLQVLKDKALQAVGPMLYPASLPVGVASGAAPPPAGGDRRSR